MDSIKSISNGFAHKSFKICKGASAFMALVALFLLPRSALAVEFCSVPEQPGQWDIADNSSSTVNVEFPVGDAATSIEQINHVSLQILHEYAGDLQATLVSPDNTSVQLFSLGDPSGCSTADYDVTFTDSATAGPLTLATEGSLCNLSADSRSGDATQGGMVSGGTANPFVFSPDSLVATPAISGNLKPVQALSNLVGSTPTGIWEIQLNDAYSQDVGSIRQACLDIDYTSVTYDIWVSSNATCTDQQDTATFDVGDTVYVCYEVSNQGTQTWELQGIDNINNHGQDLSALNGNYAIKNDAGDEQVVVKTFTAGSASLPEGVSTLLTGQITVRGTDTVFTSSDSLTTDETVTITVNDATAPVVSISAVPLANSSNETNYPVSGTCTVGDGNVTASITGATPSTQAVTCQPDGSWEATFDVSGIADGTNAIIVNASQTDSSSNIGNAVTVYADKDAVAPTLTANNVGPTPDSTPTFDGTTDQPDGATVTVTDSGNNILCNATVSSGAWSCTSTTPLGDGSHTLTADTTDSSGNLTSINFTASIQLDSDGDGIPDSTEGNGDADGDGTPNYLDTDSDGDGILDATEGVGDADNDGTSNYLDTDSDGDGIPDAVEGTVDTDGDSVSNFLDPDSDNDGINDGVEGTTDSDSDGTPNYLDSDSDGDSIPDVTEGSTDSDSDGTPNYLDTDSDDDGIPDAI
ncbi:MAG: Ig-like domain-containing protein, partial [Kangiella sp.]|nr:Ig-like domain-containing protein [Kangiella sp.]